MDDPARPGSVTRPTRPEALVPDGLDATLVLLRHGETDFIVEGRFQGQAESALSPLGRRQVELAARRLTTPAEVPVLPVPSGPPDAILHSPLRRTTETAAAVGRAFTAIGEHPPVRPEPGLLEIGQGEWEGLTRAVIGERYATELAAWRREPLASWAPGGESVVEVADRVRPALRATLAGLADGRANGGAKGPPADRSPVEGYRAGGPTDQPWTILVGHDGVFKVVLLVLFELPLDRFWSFPFALAGLTIVELRDGRPSLRAHNLTAHLAPLADADRAAELASEAAADAREQSGAL